jgi:hypothetical protein
MFIGKAVMISPLQLVPPVQGFFSPASPSVVPQQAFSSQMYFASSRPAHRVSLTCEDMGVYGMPEGTDCSNIMSIIGGGDD